MKFKPELIKLLSKIIALFLSFLLIYFLLFHFVFYGIGVIIILLFSLIVILSLVVSGVIIFIRKKKINTFIVIIILILSIFLSLILSIKLMNYESVCTEKQAIIIVNCLEKFYIDNNSYPTNLTELIPKYINDIPKTCMLQGNRDYNYYNTNDGKYRLEYYYGNQLKVYDKINNVWHLQPRG